MQTSPPPTPSAPRVRRGRYWRVLFAVLILGLLAVVVPGSPVNLSVLLRPQPTYDGLTVGQLTAGLSDSDPDTRRNSAASLGRLNTDAASALPRLAEVLREDPDPVVRAAAAHAISRMAPASRDWVNDLAAALGDSEPMVRMNAAIALCSLKEAARPAVPALISAAQDEDNDTNLIWFDISIRQASMRALGFAAAGTAEAVPTLSMVLDRPAPSTTRAIAAQGLGLAGSQARDTAPVLRALLNDPSEDVRFAAEEALDRIGADRNGPIRRGEFDGLELAEAEQQRLWEIEHRVNLINKYGFEPLAAALVRGDGAELARFLAPRFVGSEPGDPVRMKSSGFADVERIQDAGRPPIALTGPQFVSRFVELRKLFAAAPKVKLVAATLKPKSIADSEGVWEGVAQLRFHGEAGPGAPCEVVAAIEFEVPKPTEDMLAAGGWLHAARIRQLAVAQSPRYLFAETAKERGLNVSAMHDNWTSELVLSTTGGVFVTDYNRDGHLDLLVTDLNGITLYQGGPGGKFLDATTRVGLPRNTATSLMAAWVDLDGDGWDDLIVDAKVYRNEGGTKFVEYTDRFRLRFPHNPSSILVADYDRDGKLDLYFTRTGPPGNLSWLQGVTDDAKGNLLFRNLGNWQFEDVTKKSGTRGGYQSTFTAAWLDVDDDGWPDLMVPNEFGDGILLVNNRDGTFRPRPLSDRLTDFGTMGLAVGDVDNDGRIDIYCANMYSKAGTRVIGNLKPDAFPPKVMDKFRRFVAGSQLHLNSGGYKFEHVGAEKLLASVGWAYGPALADLDGDGLLDVYATAGYISRDRNKPDG